MWADSIRCISALKKKEDLQSWRINQGGAGLYWWMPFVYKNHTSVGQQWETNRNNWWEMEKVYSRWEKAWKVVESSFEFVQSAEDVSKCC